jgi:hypothetical protein
MPSNTDNKREASVLDNAKGKEVLGDSQNTTNNKTMNKNETIAALEKQTVSALRLAAEKDGIELPAKAKKTKIVEVMIMHYFPSPSDEAVTEAVENSKAAKKPEFPHRVKLAKVFDTFHSLLPENGDKVDSVEGVTAEFWKARPEAADFGGVTLRFNDDSNPTGKDRAIIGNIRKALKSCGITVSTIVLRRGGSGALYV